MARIFFNHGLELELYGKPRVVPELYITSNSIVMVKQCIKRYPKTIVKFRIKDSRGFELYSPEISDLERQIKKRNEKLIATATCFICGKKTRSETSCSSECSARYKRKTDKNIDWSWEKGTWHDWINEHYVVLNEKCQICNSWKDSGVCKPCQEKRKGLLEIGKRLRQITKLVNKAVGIRFRTGLFVSERNQRKNIPREISELKKTMNNARTSIGPIIGHMKNLRLEFFREYSSREKYNLKDHLPFSMIIEFSFSVDEIPFVFACPADSILIGSRFVRLRNYTYYDGSHLVQEITIIE